MHHFREILSEYLGCSICFLIHRNKTAENNLLLLLLLDKSIRVVEAAASAETPQLPLLDSSSPAHPVGP